MQSVRVGLSRTHLLLVARAPFPYPQQLNIAIISGLETPFKVRQFTSSLPGALLPRRPVNPAAQYGGISGYKLAVRSLIVFSIIVSLVVCKQ